MITDSFFKFTYLISLFFSLDFWDSPFSDATFQTRFFPTRLSNSILDFWLDTGHSTLSDPRQHREGRVGTWQQNLAGGHNSLLCQCSLLWRPGHDVKLHPTEWCPGHDVKLHPHFHCHLQLLYWCVMRPASQHFFIHSCIYLRFSIISVLATFLGTNSLSVLMYRKAVNQSIVCCGYEGWAYDFSTHAILKYVY